MTLYYFVLVSTQHENSDQGSPICIETKPKMLPQPAVKGCFVGEVDLEASHTSSKECTSGTSNVHQKPIEWTH